MYLYAKKDVGIKIYTLINIYVFSKKTNRKYKIKFRNLLFLFVNEMASRKKLILMESKMFIRSL